MRRIRPSIRLLVAVVSLAGFAMAAPMTVAHDNCTHGRVVLYEDANLEGDPKVFCADDDNLANNAHTFPGLCNAPWHANDSWNNCVSSFQITQLEPGHCFQLYNNAFYESVIGPEYWGPGAEGGYNITGLWNDSVTSLRFGTTSATC